MTQVNEIPNLWPSEIARTTVRSPVMILKSQAAELSRMTQGIVRGEVVAADTTFDDQVSAYLDAVAPAAQNLRRRLITIQYSADGAYPVFVTGGDSLPRHASSEEAFLQELGERLGSGASISAVQSLIARSNEVTSEKT